MAKYAFKNPEGPDPSNGGVRRTNLHNGGKGSGYGAQLHKAVTPKGGRATVGQGVKNLFKRR